MKKIKVCEQCGESFSRSDNKYRPARFCSRKCNLDFNAVLWKTKENPIKKIDNSGKNNPMFGKIPYNFKPEGSHRKDGYVRIAVKGKRVLKHRLLVERFLGRKLRRDELVHHIDGDNRNNDISNLRIVTPKEHIKLHREDLARGRVANLRCKQ